MGRNITSTGDSSEESDNVESSDTNDSIVDKKLIDSVCETARNFSDEEDEFSATTRKLEENENKTVLPDEKQSTENPSDYSFLDAVQSRVDIYTTENNNGAVSSHTCQNQTNNDRNDDSCSVEKQRVPRGSPSDGEELNPTENVSVNTKSNDEMQTDTNNNGTLEEMMAQTRWFSIKCKNVPLASCTLDGTLHLDADEAFELRNVQNHGGSIESKAVKSAKKREDLKIGAVSGKCKPTKFDFNEDDKKRPSKRKLESDSDESEDDTRGNKGFRKTSLAQSRKRKRRLKINKSSEDGDSVEAENEDDEFHEENSYGKDERISKKSKRTREDVRAGGRKKNQADKTEGISEKFGGLSSLSANALTAKPEGTPSRIRPSDEETDKSSSDENDADSNDDRNHEKRRKKNRKSKGKVSNKDNDNDSKLIRLIRLLKVANLRIKSYTNFFRDCESVKEKETRVIKYLQEKGLKGSPTIKNCKILRQKLDMDKEINELNAENIIDSDTDNKKHRLTRSKYLSVAKKRKIQRIRSDSDSSSEMNRKSLSLLNCSSDFEF